MNDSSDTLENHVTAIELKSKADLQLADYYEKLIVLGAGGVAGGATISASLAIKLGKLSGMTLLIEALVLMGISTVCAIFSNCSVAASSIINLHLVASYKQGGDLKVRSDQRLVRQSHPFWERLNRALLWLGKRSSGLDAEFRKLLFCIVVSGILATGFMLYVIFVIENVLRFSR